MLSGIIIPCVAGGAGADIGRVSISNCLVIVAVAGQAAHDGAMIARVAAARGVQVTDRCPATGDVAARTILGGDKMACRFTRCRNSIVAVEAVAGNALMIPTATHKSGGAVTKTAVDAGGQVIRRFTRCSYAVVAQLAACRGCAE